MAKVTEIGVALNRINQLITAGCIVRNDEVVGSIPTSSTKLLIFPHLRYLSGLPAAGFCC
jgi:hypothetical protein